MNQAQQQIIKIIKLHGSVCAADLADLEIDREYLSRMAKKGILQRIARGRYALPDTDITEHHELAVFASQVPKERMGTGIYIAIIL